MPQVNSNLVGQLQATLGFSGGTGVEVPDMVLPTLHLPKPWTSSPDTSLGDQDASGTEDTIAFNVVINQGASQAPNGRGVKLNRGLYRIQGFLMSRTFSIAASSANIKACRAIIYEPTLSQGAEFASTPIHDGVPHVVTFNFIVHLVKPGFMVAFESWQTTGVGESLGFEAGCWCSKLL